MITDNTWYLIYWLHPVTSDGGFATNHIEFNSKAAAEKALELASAIDNNFYGIVVRKGNIHES